MSNEINPELFTRTKRDILAYTNTIHTKKSAVALAQFHYDADNFRKAWFWQDNKGCSVGCMVKDYRKDQDIDWHECQEILYGIPREISYLQNWIFNGLPHKDAKEWTPRLMSAIQVGADLSLITTPFIYWLLTGDVQKIAKHESFIALSYVTTLYKRKMQGHEPGEQELMAAENKVDIAYRSAKDSNGSYVADLADAAFLNDVSYACGAAGYALGKSYYNKMADKVIALCKFLPVDKYKIETKSIHRQNL